MLLRNRPRDIQYAMTSYHGRISTAERTRVFQRQLNNPSLQPVAGLAEIDNEDVKPGHGPHTDAQVDAWMRQAKLQLDAMHATFPGYKFAMANLPVALGVTNGVGPVLHAAVVRRLAAVTRPLDDGRSVVDASGYITSNLYVIQPIADAPNRWQRMFDGVRWFSDRIRTLGKTTMATLSPFTHASLNMVPLDLQQQLLDVALDSYDHVALWSIWNEDRTWDEAVDRSWYELYRSAA
jgi:hypothetical protein